MSELHPEQSQAQGPPSGFRLGIWILSATLLVVFAVAITVWAYLGASLLGVWRAAFGPTQTIINVSQPTVVRQIQQLKRLETVAYTMEKIVEGERDSGPLPKFLTGDRLLLIVHGEVVAGIELGGVGLSDVVVNGRSIKLRIPRPEIFSTRIDNGKSRVYSRDTGILAWADPNLETEVRREAERQLREAALQDGILRAAEQNARVTLASLLKGFGFEQVDVVSSGPD